MIKYTQTSREEDFMLDHYLEYLDILDVYCQNDFQEIYICKHKEQNAYYLLNSVKSKEVFESIDLEELKKHISCIKEIVETDESILILTEHYFHKTLSEYVKTENMTLSKQVNSVAYLMDNLLKLKTLSYSVVISLFNHNNLVVDDNGEMKSTGMLLLIPEILNASREDALATIANTIHMIFTREEIIDGNISKKVPPDIEKIINNCLNGDYYKAQDLVIDFKSSNTYRIINPEKEDIKRVAHMRKSMTRKRITYNIKSKGALAILLLIPVIVFGSYSLLKSIKTNNDIISNDMKANVSESTDANDIKIEETTNLAEENNYIEGTTNKEENEDDYIEDIFNYKENMDKFFNKDKIALLNEKRTAEVDSSKYHRGEYSLKIHNDSREKAPYLAGYIDFQDDNFDFVKNRTVNLSLWVNSDVATDASITLKLGSSDAILSQITKKVKLVADTWTLHNIEINTKNGQYIKIYINIEPNDTIWIDTMDIAILK